MSVRVVHDDWGLSNCCWVDSLDEWHLICHDSMEKSSSRIPARIRICLQEGVVTTWI